MCLTNIRLLANRIEIDDLALPDADAADLPANGSPVELAPPEGVSLEDYLEDIESQAIHHALEQTGNNKTAAANLLGITFRAMRRTNPKAHIRRGYYAALITASSIFLGAAR